MKRAVRCWLAGSVVLLALACGHRRLPPGTPPPEYEQPVVPPWSGPDAGAGVEPLAPEPSAEPPTEPPTPEPVIEGAPDAGAPALLDGGSPEAG